MCFFFLKHSFIDFICVNNTIYYGIILHFRSHLVVHILSSNNMFIDGFMCYLEVAKTSHVWRVHLQGFVGVMAAWGNGLCSFHCGGCTHHPGDHPYSSSIVEIGRFST